MNNCGYNKGGICGNAATARMNADACKRSGNRAFAKKCADEFLVRRANEACATGNDCYDMGRANVCASGAQIAGNRACGNANNCYNNAAGLNCNARGFGGRYCNARNCLTGCGSPC